MALRIPQPQFGGMPRLPQYGYMNDVPVMSEPVEIPRLDLPEVEVPLIARVQYGAGDKDIVGALLRIANGEASDLPGISPSPTYAVDLLTGWDYPTSMDAWNADQWANAIGTNAQMPTPLDILEGY